MLKVIFLLMFGIFIGFYLGIFTLIYKDYAGTVVFKLVNNRLESSQLCFENKERKDKVLHKKKLIILLVDRIHYTDPDEIQPQEIQSL